MAIATMADSHVPSRDVGLLVRAELTNLLFDNTRGTHLAAVIVAALLVALAWHTSVNQLALSAWLAGMLALETARGLLNRRFRYLRIDGMNAALWERRFLVGNALSACGWGVAGALLFPSGDVAHQLFLATIIMSACALAMPALSPSLKSYAVFISLAGLPLIIRLLLTFHALQTAAALLAVVMSALLLRMSMGMHKRLVDQLNTRFAFADIADELRAEMADRKRAEEQLTQLANFDSLTGLPNRTLFEQKLGNAIKRARRGDAQLAVLFVDLDRFKHINDSLGHQTGDLVLKRVAQRLKRCIKDRDTVARLSGDEFIVLVEHVDKRRDIEHLAERILRTLAKPMLLSETELRVTGSVGITLLAADSPDAKSLLANADTALYRAKHRGRNSYQFFTPDMHEAALKRLKREVELRKALTRGELVLHYQPLFDVLKGEIMGLEALLRWHSQEFGLVGPAEFIPLAEETGLIIPIGEWVLREACRQAVQWRNVYGAEFHMAVNLSARQFTVPDLASTVGRILGESGLPPQALILEITESVALSNEASNLEELVKLRSMGISLALDDFGTGNSSLGYLKRFPIDVLKLDRSFVHDVALNHEDAAVARATIKLANSLGHRVVAEGVENADQLEWLQMESCALIQGFLLSEPLDAHSCEKLMTAHAWGRLPPGSVKVN
ncbi:MAG: EAL domain-containing protein [Gammaproteobacteria bacterium]|nr:EAL domain-containing protein [Gammaproteobacteria bacterium]MDE2345443.1 EAL domain-containing protein [Gammaproteobacteria bacterium]